MKLTTKLKNNQKSFGGLPFWSWNDKLEEKELRRQINNMKDIGLNGFFMHARGGLMTEYCSDEWYDCIKACIDEAKKLGMEAWAYDENGWPSGFAGGKLLEDSKNHVGFLTHKIGSFDKNAFKVYNFDGSIANTDHEKEYLNVYREYSSSYVDVMDKNIIEKFIKYTHEEYKAHFPEDFGKTMPGFFTDEPQYYRYNTAWSDTFLKNFEEAYGYSVFNAIPALFIDFEGAKELRYDYWALCHKQFMEAFAKQIYDWCETNGAKLTGHGIEEESLAFQMVCCGGVMPFYEYEHVPGIDHLGRYTNNDLSPKQIGSVAAQLNKKKVLTETFALCGWDVSPTELKRIAQWQFVGGVNLICSHLYPYSERGERKYDYPAHYSDHLPWNSYYKDFNNYFANIGAALAEGKEKANVLILHPMHSLYLYFKRINSDESVKHLEAPFRALLDKYGNNFVQYHLGDEIIISHHGKVEGSKFIIGQCAYDYVVLPEMETLDSCTAELLKEFIKNGGKVVSEGNKPTRIDGKIADLSWIEANSSFEEILEAREAYLYKDGNILENFRINVRETENGRIFYIVNLNESSFDNVSFVVKKAKGLKQIHMLNLKEDTLTLKKNKGSLEATLNFDNAGSYFIYETKSFKTKESVVNKALETTIGTEDFKLNKKIENCMVLDYACLSYDGINYEPKRYIKHIHELLLKRKYEGRAYLKFDFNADFIPKDLALCVEPFKNPEILINGKSVSLTDKWRTDRSFKLADIYDKTKKGKNEIVISFDYYQSPHVYNVLFSNVMESLRNCLSLDTEIEAIYLFGSFGVKAENDYYDGMHGSKLNDGPFTLVKQVSLLNAKDLTSGQFPFFAGRISLNKTFTAKEGQYIISLPGRYAVCNLYINNKKVKRLFFDKTAIINLKDGENTIRIELINSLRNTFGPLHHVNDELFAVGPRSFTFEGDWNEENEAKDYTKRYSFMHFGIDEITLEKL